MILEKENEIEFKNSFVPKVYLMIKNIYIVFHIKMKYLWLKEIQN